MLKNDIYNRSGVIMGLAGAAINLLALVLMYQYSPTPYTTFSFAGLVIPVVIVFFIGIYYRGVKRDLPLSFTQLIRMGFWVTIICAGIFMFLYVAYIKMDEPVFMANFLREYKDMMLASKVSQEGMLTEPILQKSLEELKQFSAWDIVFKDFKLKVLFGTASSLIIAVILRK